MKYYYNQLQQALGDIEYFVKRWQGSKEIRSWILQRIAETPDLPDEECLNQENDDARTG